MTRIAPARAVFPDVPPMPGAAGEAENPRVHIGANAPPLDQQIVIEFDAAIDATPNLRARLDQLVARVGKVPACTNDDDVGKVGDLVRIAVAARKAVEAAHQKAKEPYLAATRAVDGARRAIVDTLDDLKREAEASIGAWQAEIRRREQEEAKRIAAEQARLAREAAERDAAARAAEAEQNADGADPCPSDREAVALTPPPPPPEPVAAPAPPPVVRGDLGSRVGTRKVWKHEIVKGVRGLPNEILTNERVVAAINAVIAQQVNGGVRTIKGVKIWSEDVVSVRGS